MMSRDEQPAPPPASETTSPPRPRFPLPGVKTLAVALALCAAGLGVGASRWFCAAPAVAPHPRTSLQLPPKQRLFDKWPRPDFAVVLSAQQHGYLLPCGCSRPQKGGLERRYNFIQILRDLGWPVVAVDLGDVPQERGPAGLQNLQQLIKYRYSMFALKEMDYTAAGVGELEVGNLARFNGEYALNESRPRVLASNLLKRDEYPGFEAWAATTPEGSDVKVGVASVVGAFVQEKRLKNAGVRFGAAAETLTALRKKEVPATDFRILLYHGYTDKGVHGKSEAAACAEAFPEYQLLLCLCETDEPSADPVVVRHKGGESMLVTLGHKGKHVGVVGVYKTGNKQQPFALRYQMVTLEEDYVTPAAEEKDHPVLRLMEEYTAELKRGDYLAKYPPRKHPLEAAAPPKSGAPRYEGSETCKDCHKHAYEVWSKTGHAHAYQTLVDANRPANRQYDPECIVCHTVGFGFNGGYTDAKKTDYLKNVGCESCHGPCSEHVLNPKDATWHRLINPWKYEPVAAKRRRQTEDLCIQCHDLENDVNWKADAFEKKWEEIKHYTPKKPGKGKPAAP